MRRTSRRRGTVEKRDVTGSRKAYSALIEVLFPIGYAILAAGTIAEVLVVHIGRVLSIPGGLFEVALGFWLVIKGFRREAYHQGVMRLMRPRRQPGEERHHEGDHPGLVRLT